MTHRVSSTSSHRLVFTASLVSVLACGPTEPLADRIEALIADSNAETVSVYYKHLSRPDSLFIAPDVRMHAASMMKVPVMIRLHDLATNGRIALDDSIMITKRFSSIVDGSPYDLTAPEDSDSVLYNRVGQHESVRALIERMITVSSNLATNILIEVANARQTTLRMRELGADSIQVLRGVEDIKAFELGLSNTTTARDLGLIFEAIASGSAGTPEAQQEMIGVLSRQFFDEGIPSGLPEDVTVAHKTGSITEIRHDGGIVYPSEGHPYVLVVLTRGFADPNEADQLIGEISRLVYASASRAT